MRVSKPLLYCNIVALMVNGIIVWLMVAKVFAPMLGISIFLGCLAGAVWLSCLANGKVSKKRRNRTFYSAPTEEVERL